MPRAPFEGAPRDRKGRSLAPAAPMEGHAEYGGRGGRRRRRAWGGDTNTLVNNIDMVVGQRVSEAELAYRRGHRFGNAMLTGMLSKLFGRSFTDILSGYRVFSRRFVKSFPVLSVGFEIETEISVHALELKMPCAEIATPYYARPEGSASKLSTYSDGWRILRTILKLYRIERPMWFFGAIAGLFAGLALLLAPGRGQQGE